MVTTCVFPRRAQTTPLSEQEEVLFPSNFGTLVTLSQGGGGTLINQQVIDKTWH